MRPLPGFRTWLVVAAVCALGIVAAVDAFRADEKAAKPSGEEAEIAARARTVARLREAGVTGVLTYSDERCRLAAVTLPDLAPHPAPPGRSCSFIFSGSGDVSFSPEVSDPGGLTARCRNGVIEVFYLPSGYGQVPGCNPAWKPDGSLTAIREGEVVRLDLFPEEERIVTRVLVSKRDVVRAFSQANPSCSDVSLKTFLWVDDTTVATVAGASCGEGQDDFLAVIRGRELLRSPLGPYARLSRLRVSPLGTYLAARSEGSERGVVVANADGEQLRFFPSALTIAWSPDERWTAVASGRGEISDTLALLDTERSTEIRLPIVVSDLVWR